MGTVFEEYAFGLFVYHFVTVGPAKLSIAIEYYIPLETVSHVHQHIFYYLAIALNVYANKYL